MAIIHLDLKGFFLGLVNLIFIPPILYFIIYLMYGKEALRKFMVSNFADFIGIMSFIFPVAGDASDIRWGPIQALIACMLYGFSRLSLVSGIEELLPFADWIPSLTILWFYDRYEKEKMG